MSIIKKFRIKNFKKKIRILKIRKNFFKFGKKIILDDLNFKFKSRSNFWFIRSKWSWKINNI